MRRRGYNQKSILQMEREGNAFIIVPRPFKDKKNCAYCKEKESMYVHVHRFEWLRPTRVKFYIVEEE